VYANFKVSLADRPDGCADPKNSSRFQVELEAERDLQCSRVNTDIVISYRSH